jgi:hypothetical protein
MKQRTRIFVGIGVLAFIVLIVGGVELLRRKAVVSPAVTHGQNAPVVTLVPGSIPIYVDSQLTAGFSPDGLSQLKKVSFVEAAEGVTEEGWLVRDVLLLYLPPESFEPDTQIIVSSTSRGKTAQLTWAEVSAEENMVMFDLANRGTLKLASKLEKLDTREEWVQDVDKIEVIHRKVE